MIGGLIGGLGGVGAYIRARGQNTTDDRSQLSLEQQAFRSDMRSELAALRQALADAEARSDRQDEQIRAQADKLATQSAQLTALTEEKAALIQRLQVVSGMKDFLEREVNALREETRRLQAQLPARTEVKE